MSKWQKIAEKYGLKYGYDIDVGETGRQYTLRFLYPEFGAGVVINGVFNGAVYQKSAHVKNLGKDYMDAYEKALKYAQEKSLPLYAEKENAPDLPENRKKDHSKFNFGKHAGKTIQEVAKVDPEYIVWAKQNITRGTKQFIKNLAEI